MEAATILATHQFIPVPSVWYSAKLEEMAANVEITPDGIRAQYQRREMPSHIEERCVELGEFWDKLCEVDALARAAEYQP